jgi:hypothetical protein
MPGLILPKRWTSQPQYPVGLVDEFAKATLALNLIAGVEARCLATGRVLTKASPVAKINAIGKGVGCSDTTRAYLDTGWSPFSTSNGDGTGDFSVITSFTATSSATRGALLHSRCNTTPFSTFLIRPNTSYVIGDTTGTSTPTSGNIFVGTFENSISGIQGFNLSGLATGQPLTIVFVRSGGTMRVHVNRSTQSTSATAIDLVTATGADLLFALGGFASATGSALEGTQNSCVVLPFAIPESEGAALSLNPWQIFRPQTRRIFFGLGAGGPATYNVDQTDAATLSDSITSAAIFGSAQTDALTLAETETGLAIFPVSQTDAATLAESQSTSGATYAVSQSDALTLADSHNASVGGGAVYDVSQSEALSLADASTSLCVFPSALIEPAALADAVAATGVFPVVAAEAVSLAETQAAPQAGSGAGATAAEIWAYEIAPGLSAGQALLDLWQAKHTPADVADAVVSHAQTLTVGKFVALNDGG